MVLSDGWGMRQTLVFLRLAAPLMLSPLRRTDVLALAELRETEEGSRSFANFGLGGVNSFPSAPRIFCLILLRPHLLSSASVAYSTVQPSSLKSMTASF